MAINQMEPLAKDSDGQDSSGCTLTMLDHNGFYGRPSCDTSRVLIRAWGARYCPLCGALQEQCWEEAVDRYVY